MLCAQHRWSCGKDCGLYYHDGVLGRQGPRDRAHRLPGLGQDDAAQPHPLRQPRQEGRRLPAAHALNTLSLLSATPHQTAPNHCAATARRRSP
eukprot:5015559-Prymnesium_polylepis.2